MNTAQWRGLVDHILYAVMFRQSLDDAAVDSTARTILSRQGLAAGPEAYSAAADLALASADPLTQSFDTPHSEQDLRAFLGRLRHRLEELRPWPEPSYVRLPIENWQSFAAARPIAQVGQSLMNVQDRLAERFERLPGDPTRSVLILRLESGHTVGLVGSYQPAGPVTLLQRDPGPPQPVIAALLASTAVSDDMVVPLSATEQA
ncbi:hypothetical protein [Melissospora conviva]|uniref:hypothetical protein n=1 Tax=Melissospora conviva TaxID=3388432 RepID=UPI003B7BD3E2